MERELIGHVGVDSGQLMVIDPCYVDSEWVHGDFTDTSGSYRKASDLTKLSSRSHGILPFKLGHPGMAAVFASGYGDGLYPVYAHKNAEGRVVRVEIVMDDEEDG